MDFSLLDSHQELLLDNLVVKEISIVFQIKLK